MKTSKIQKQAEKIRKRIAAITADKSLVSASYNISDNSVQAELRLEVQWKISYPVDSINYPRELNPDRPDRKLWAQMREISQEIAKTAELSQTPTGYRYHFIEINERTKTGPAKRAEAKAAWLVEAGRQFLAEYRTVSGKRHLAHIRKQIVELQSRQKSLLPQLRAANSQYIAIRKQQSDERKRKNTEALKSGRFWEADKNVLKAYFHPPFDKNYLADVSEKWRGALFLECESVSFKLYSGAWGHKLSGTGHGYLCGIDDNGDEWGSRCWLELNYDTHNNKTLDATVEDAMSVLFEIQTHKLDKCIRQGDLLFCPVKLRKNVIQVCSNCKTEWSSSPDGDRCSNCGFRISDGYGPIEDKPVELHPHEGIWEIRESHEILSTGLIRNGRYFASDNPIYVRHTSHPIVTLPSGEYRLYELQIENVD